MAYVLALLSAVFYGSADFLGGLASRRTPTSVVIVISGMVGLVLLVVLLPRLPGNAPSVADFGWGSAAGLAGGIGLGLLYRALSISLMAVVAPTTALCAVGIPVVA